MSEETHRTPPTAMAGRSLWVDAPQNSRLHLLEYGDHAAPPLLIVPGITSPAITWEFVAERLADDYRVLSLDIRGRGLSDTGSRFSWSDYAADLKSVIEGLGLERPVLLGHSAGALMVVTFDALYPGLAGPIVVADPPLSGPGRPPYATPLEAFVSSLRQAKAGATAEDMRPFFPTWSESALELRAAWLGTCDETAIVATYNGFHEEDLFDYWPAVTAPALFVWGGASPVVGAEGAKEVAEANPAANVIELPGSGHMLPWDQLEGFLTLVRGFLDPFVPK